MPKTSRELGVYRNTANCRPKEREKIIPMYLAMQPKK